MAIAFPTCSRCWRDMPRGMAADLGSAWNDRERYPAMFAERLAGALQWNRDQRIAVARAAAERMRADS